MSRKFIDDHARKLGPIADLPGSDSTAYDPGHEYQDQITGTTYLNQGSKKHGAIYTNDIANRFELTERFEKTPLLNADILITDTAPTLAQMALIWRANVNFEAAGTNMTSALCTHSTGGGITLTTAGADEDQAFVQPHTDSLATAWTTADFATDDRVIFESTIQTGAAITASIIHAGLKLTNDNVVATDAEQAFLRYEAGVNSGAWQLITSDNGVDTTTNTSVTVAVSTSYHLKIVINGDRDVTAFINGVLVARVAAALGTGHDLIPFLGIEASAAAAKALTVRNLRVSKDFND
jgi:hypothetical protein